MTILRSILFLIAFSAVSVFGQQPVRIPNIITPNGDGVNDAFVIRATDYEELECTILNRHGEVVYRFFGLNGSWDGHTHAGVKVSAGTYFVFVEVTDADENTDTFQGTLQVQY